MERSEYMRTKISNPKDFVKQHNIVSISTKDGYIYIEIRKGMYGIPQAGILAQKLLDKHLNEKGYRYIKLTPGLWKHDLLPIYFTLCVENFGVNYVEKEHDEHLIKISIKTTPYCKIGKEHSIWE